MPTPDAGPTHADNSLSATPSAHSRPDLLWLVAAIPFLLLLLFVVQGALEVRCAAGSATEVLVDGREVQMASPGVYRTGRKLIGSHAVSVRVAGRPDLRTSAFVWLSQTVVVDAEGGSPSGSADGMRTANSATSGAHGSAAPSSESADHEASIDRGAVGGSTDGRFEELACGAILDTHTGHRWLLGPDHNFSYAEARAWASAQASCGGQWRLPTQSEVHSLVELNKTAGTGFESGGRSWPAHIDPVFSAIGSGSWVWLATQPVADRGETWNLNQNSRAQMSASAPEFPVRVFAIQ